MINKELNLFTFEFPKFLDDWDERECVLMNDEQWDDLECFESRDWKIEEHNVGRKITWVVVVAQ